jgi:hypothetical protein
LQFAVTKNLRRLRQMFMICYDFREHDGSVTHGVQESYELREDAEGARESLIKSDEAFNISLEEVEYD